jgi:hypothetical protein
MLCLLSSPISENLIPENFESNSDRLVSSGVRLITLAVLESPSFGEFKRYLTKL